MKSLRDLLREADPLRHEPEALPQDRDCIRLAILALTSSMTTAPPRLPRRPIRLAAVVLLVVGLMAVGMQVWSRAGSTLHAAVLFEVRLAEEFPGTGLREARIGRSERVVYLHEEVVATNADIAASRITVGDEPSSFHVQVEFTATGAQRMQQGTAGHTGRPLAILIDGEVVAAPVLRGRISRSAVISGNYSQAEAERIAEGIRLH